MDNTLKLYAVPGAHNIIDTINPHTGRTSVLGQTFEEVLAREPLAVCLTWEEWKAQQIERQQSPIRWAETTEPKYREMLEVLPPAFWVRGLFLVGEAMDHDYATGRPRFTAYWHRSTAAGLFDRYLVASRPMTIAEARAIVAGPGQAVRDLGTGYPD
jgi:hypothetical protein